jgi:hypothetical protein
MTGYVPKPIEQRLLIHEIHRVLSREVAQIAEGTFDPVAKRSRLGHCA